MRLQCRVSRLGERVGKLFRSNSDQSSIAVYGQEFCKHLTVQHLYSFSKGFIFGFLLTVSNHLIRRSDIENWFVSTMLDLVKSLSNQAVRRQ